MADNTSLGALERLSDILSNKDETTFQLESTTADSHILSDKLGVPYKQKNNRTYKASMLQFTTYNFIVNITTTNNVFRYSNNGGSTWKTILYPTPAAVEIDQIDTEIKRRRANNDWDEANNKYYINIIARVDINRFAAEITHENYRLDLEVANTITNFFGFNENTTPLAKGYHIADNQAVITTVNLIHLTCDIIDGGYVKGKPRGIIFTIPSFTVPIGAKIIAMPINPTA